MVKAVREFNTQPLNAKYPSGRCRTKIPLDKKVLCTKDGEVQKKVT